MAIPTQSFKPIDPVPGVHRLLTKEDLELSFNIATSLPRINKDMKVQEDHLRALTTIISGHSMVGKLAVHLLHSHEPLKEGHIKLENKLEIVPAKWMRPVFADSLDPASIHGLTFKIERRSVGGAGFALIPYEFAKGPSPITKDDKKALGCMAEIVEYLIQNTLTDILALQFVNDDLSAGPTAEVEVGGLGTMTLPQSIQRLGTLVPVSWPGSTLVDAVSQLSEPPPGQHWNEATKSDGTKTHKVHVDNVDTIEDILESLVGQGILIGVF
ncbi:hypothetical protein F5Y16DRAFT_391575 [Xylariaceae sp. FL0255]|nr:hypothetical protein F5Y16DRAFT_391575 [Xylariaceae sp. FL0255]